MRYIVSQISRKTALADALSFAKTYHQLQSQEILFQRMQRLLLAKRAEEAIREWQDVALREEEKEGALTSVVDWVVQKADHCAAQARATPTKRALLLQELVQWLKVLQAMLPFAKDSDTECAMLTDLVKRCLLLHASFSFPLSVSDLRACAQSCAHTFSTGCTQQPSTTTLGTAPQGCQSAVHDCLEELLNPLADEEPLKANEEEKVYSLALYFARLIRSPQDGEEAAYQHVVEQLLSSHPVYHAVTLRAKAPSLHALVKSEKVAQSWAVLDARLLQVACHTLQTVTNMTLKEANMIRALHHVCGYHLQHATSISRTFLFFLLFSRLALT